MDMIRGNLCKPFVREIYRNLEEIEQTQWQSRDQLREMQWNGLKRMVEYAYTNVPYYQAKFRSLGILPEDINDFEDFHQLPLLTKHDIRENFDSIQSKLKKFGRKPYNTSGSTGIPLSVLWDRGDYMRNLAFKYRGHRWHEVDIGEREARIWGVPIDLKGRAVLWTKDFLLNRIRLSALSLTEDAMYHFYRKCVRFQPRLIYGYATALYDFSRFIAERQLDSKAINVKVVISTSEVLYRSHKEVIEQVLGCRVFNEYGSVETGIIAFECPHGGMHICTEGVYIEFLDDGSMDGDINEIIVTNLYNYAMPLIRYRLGDAGIPSDEKCTCGRGLPVMKLEIAKVMDFIATPSGKMFHGELFHYINIDIMKAGIKGIRQFKVFQESVTDFLVQIVKDSEFTPRCTQVFANKMREFLGDHISVSFEFPTEIPRDPSGKLKYFVSKIGHSAT